jgi:hypothetical protein
MGKHGNKYQVNLHSQKIAKISLKTCRYAFSVNSRVICKTRYRSIWQMLRFVKQYRTFHS